MPETPEYSVVTPSEASQKPYPYVYVNEDKTVRELHQAERNHLEERFSPFDGARPYVKFNFEALDGWRSPKGFCHRSHIPADIVVAPAPADDPNPPMSAAQHIEWLKKKMVGFEVVQKSDGSVQMKRIAPPLRSSKGWLRRLLGRGE